MSAVVVNRVLPSKTQSVCGFLVAAARRPIKSLIRISGERGVMKPRSVLANPPLVKVELSIVEELPAETKTERVNVPARWPISSLKRRLKDIFRLRTLVEEDVTFPRSVNLPNPEIALNVVEELPSETSGYRFPLIAARRAVASLKRGQTHYFPRGEEGVVMLESVLADPLVALNIVEEPPVETNNETAGAYKSLLIAARRAIAMRTHYFQPGTSCEGVMMPGSVLTNQMDLNIVQEELPTKSNNERASASRWAIVCLKRMWTNYFRPMTLGEEHVTMPGSVLANPMIELEIIHEEETNNETFSITNVYRFVVRAVRRSIESLSGLWTRCFPRGTLGEESVMKPGSAYKFVIIGLVSFTAIKSQGETGFPFKTHPRTIMVAITSLIVLGLASKAEHAIKHNSVYALTARLVRNLSAYTLVGSLASLFYL